MAAVATPVESGTPEKKKSTADWSWTWDDTNQVLDNISQTAEKVGGVVDSIGKIFNKHDEPVVAVSSSTMGSGSSAISPLLLAGVAALLLLK